MIMIGAAVLAVNLMTTPAGADALFCGDIPMPDGGTCNCSTYCDQNVVILGCGHPCTTTCVMCPPCDPGTCTPQQCTRSSSHFCS
jgi:hypothetical protein